jgi:putative oxidoreductase
MLSQESQKDLGLLILRIGVGLSFVVHGWPKLLAGPARWGALGGAMGNLGIDFAPEAFGFLAMLAELGGGILLLVGHWVRPASAAMAFTMLVATISHLSRGDGYGSASHALELCVVFIALVLIGPGSYRVRIGR